jgi:hypothetical protein
MEGQKCKASGVKSTPTTVVFRRRAA